MVSVLSEVLASGRIFHELAFLFNVKLDAIPFDVGSRAFFVSPAGHLELVKLNWYSKFKNSNFFDSHLMGILDKVFFNRGNWVAETMLDSCLQKFFSLQQGFKYSGLYMPFIETVVLNEKHFVDESSDAGKVIKARGLLAHEMGHFFHDFASSDLKNRRLLEVSHFDAAVREAIGGGSVKAEDFRLDCRSEEFWVRGAVHEGIAEHAANLVALHTGLFDLTSDYPIECLKHNVGLKLMFDLSRELGTPYFIPGLVGHIPASIREIEDVEQLAFQIKSRLNATILPEVSFQVSNFFQL